MRRAIRRLHRWFDAEARDLPWRRTTDPYAVWVSEVMLQQTQVATVVPYYQRWMAAFPTVEALAAAPEDRVLRLWEGLGYYSRARNLHRAAIVVTRRHGGRIPDDLAGLRRLPGVGPYTAAAVLSIAFGQPHAVVDGNVRRVLSRLVALDGDPRETSRARSIETLASELLAGSDPSVHNQAMMELGALVCTPRAPRCDGCPAVAACRAAATGEPDRYPPPGRRRPVPHHQIAVGVVLYRGRLLIDQRPGRGLLAGLWDLPAVQVPEDQVRQVGSRLSQALNDRYGVRGEVEGALAAVSQQYTHLRVTLHPLVCRVRERSSRAGERRSWRWVTPAALAHYAMPRAARRVLASWQA